ncbi:MAG: hypothetical protein HY719_01235 [Planctomycetes bacterium]|nr:hypothetical protein [Planctomycetota bacterium]
MIRSAGDFFRSKPASGGAWSAGSENELNADPPEESSDDDDVAATTPAAACSFDGEPTMPAAGERRALPRGGLRMYRAGLRHVAQGRWREAVEALTTCLSSDFDESYLAWPLAVAHGMLCQAEEAAKFAERNLLCSGRPGDLWLAAQASTAAGDEARAVELYGRLLEGKGCSPDYEAQVRARLEEAEAQRAGELGAGGARASHLVRAAFDLLDRGEVEDARRFLDEAGRNGPPVAEWTAARGMVALFDGDAGRAGALYREALALDPLCESALARSSEILRYTGDLVGSLRHLDALAAAHPDSIPGIAQIAEHLLLSGKTRDAAAALTRVLAARPMLDHVAVRLLDLPHAFDPEAMRARFDAFCPSHVLRMAGDIQENGGEVFANRRAAIFSSHAAVLAVDTTRVLAADLLADCAFFGFLEPGEVGAVLADVAAASTAGDARDTRLVTLEADYGAGRQRLSRRYVAGGRETREEVGRFDPAAGTPDFLRLRLDTDRRVPSTALGAGQMRGCYLLLKTTAGRLVFASDVGVAENHEWTPMRG